MNKTRSNAKTTTNRNFSNNLKAHKFQQDNEEEEMVVAKPQQNMLLIKTATF